MNPTRPRFGPIPGEELPAGAYVGTCQVHWWVSSGGMSEVYRGVLVGTDEPVALKVMTRECAFLDVALARFDREVVLLDRLVNLPHIVKACSTGLLDDGIRRYLITRWIDGEPLSHLIRWNRQNDEDWDPILATTLIRDIASALESIHLRKVVHRDLKPGNIMVERRGHALYPTLIDFGLSAELDPVSEYDENLTQGEAIGTDEYMSPEQHAGLYPAPPMDLWSLGVIMLELFGAPTLPDDLRIRGVPDWFDVNAPKPIKSIFNRLIRQCLTPDPALRPTATAVRTELEKIVPPGEDLPLLKDTKRPGSRKGELRNVGAPPRSRTDVVQAPKDAPVTLRVVSPATAEATESSPTSGSIEAPEPSSTSASIEPPEPSSASTPLETPEPSSDAAPVDTPEPRPSTKHRTAPQVAPRANTQRNITPAPAASMASMSSVSSSSTAQPHPATAPQNERESLPPASEFRARLGLLWGGAAVLALGIITLALSSKLVHSLDSPDDETSPAHASPDPASTFRKAAPSAVVRAAAVAPPPRDAAADEAPDEAPSALQPDSKVRPRNESEEPPPKNEATRLPSRATKVKPRKLANAAPAHTTDACKAHRQRAEQASDSESWSDVLRETDRSECWATPSERKFLRVEALLEIGRYKQCVVEGAGASTPAILSRVAACRKLVEP